MSAPSALILVLHGLGADAADLQPLADNFAVALPSARVLSLDAPHRFDGAGAGAPGFGRQWFSIAGVSDANRDGRIAAALPALEAMIAAELADAGLMRDRLAVVGFSQGAMMALAAAVSADPPAFVAAIAGRLSAPIASSQARSPRVLLAHGDADPVVPVRGSRDAESALRAAGIAVTSFVEPGIGHWISEDEEQVVTDFLRAALSPGA